MSARLILNTAARARNEVRELLELVFATELLRPSRCVWLVSAFLRDIPVLDNSGGAYVSLSPDLPRTQIRLSRLLSELASRGTHIVVASKPTPEGGEVGEEVQRVSDRNLITVTRRIDLHVKGVVGDSYALTGSMNFTHNGIDKLDELVRFETSPAEVQKLRSEFHQHYGGTK